MGCSLSDFLIGLRMQRAKYLLLESPARINEIAALCGYRNAYYFSNAFKKHFGVSPLRYRRERIGIADEDQSSTEERPIASRSARDSI
jgi:AraC-like DNA-binding protein